MSTLLKVEFILLAVAAAAFFILTIYLSIKLKRDRKKADKRIKALEKEVRLDYLTGTLSRRAFIREMEEELAHSGSGTLIVFDVNGFKTVNDMFGHIAGDGLIKRYAAKLLKEFDKELVGRLEGDDFVVFVPGTSASDEIVERIKKSGAARFSDKPTKLMITSCCGAAVSPDHGKNFDDLYAQADKALCYSKIHDITVSFCKDDQ